MKKVLFIDRDGTLVIEPPVDYQLDAFEKLEFYPKVFRNLYFIRQKLDFEFVMVTNQDGLGTDSFPEDTFWPVHNLMLQSFKNEGIEFDNILIDRSFPEDNALPQATHRHAHSLPEQSGIRPGRKLCDWRPRYRRRAGQELRLQGHPAATG